MHVRAAVPMTLYYNNAPLSPKVFAGLRKNSHGEGTLALPGGHLEMYETWAQCATREALEETGLELENVQFAHVTNDMMQDQNKHYVTIFMMAECCPPPSFLGLTLSYQKPQNLEPHKCDGWDSYSWDKLVSFAEKSEKVKAVADDDGEEESATPKLFGPLLQLVQESPQVVIDFMNKA